MKLGNTVTKGKKADRQDYMLHNPTPIKYILKDKEIDIYLFDIKLDSPFSVKFNIYHFHLW